MRIGIDITCLKDQYANRGIGNYCREVVKKLVVNNKYEWVLFGFDDQASNFLSLELPKESPVKFISLGNARDSTPWNFISYNLSYQHKILKEKLDLYFAPHFERGLPIHKIKTVIMMHDVIPLVTGKYSAQGKLINFLKGIFYKHNLGIARKADLILTNSDFSQRELINKAGFDSDHISRTYLGIKDMFLEGNISGDTRDLRRILMIYKISKPYILYYGGLEANKNLTNLCYAFKNITKRFPDMRLVIVGKDFKLGWDNKVQPLTRPAVQLMKLCDDLKIKHNVIFTGTVEEQHLPLILKNAELFVHLSTYEGFGFAPLEAMAAGVPVVAARRSCYPEVLQDGAELVNPTDVDKISDAIQNLLEDETKRQKLIAKGHKIANLYNWSLCATATLNAFDRLLAQTPRLKIAYLTTNFFPFNGGAENNCLNLARQMVELGHDVTVFTSDNGDTSLPSSEYHNGIKIKRAHKVNNSYYLGYYPGLFWPFLTTKFDVVHVHGFGFLWHDWMLLFKKFFSPRTKFINTPHGPFMAQKNYSTPKRMARITFNFLQHLYLNRIYAMVIGVNPQQYKWIVKYGIKQAKIIYLPNGINPDFFDPVATDTVAEKYKLNKKFVVCFTGRFEKYKGFQDAIAAMPAILKEQKSVKLIGMGHEGAYLPELQQKIKDAELTNQVEIIIKSDNTTLEAVLTLSKIFVLPSEWEAFGISILEAMAKGNAIITTRTEGGEFLIKEEENGFLFDYGDSKELSNFIIRLLNDRKLLAEISAKNIAKAKTFSWAEIARNYQNAILELYK